MIRRSTNFAGRARRATNTTTARIPHISIEDLVFVETVGGDLTVKIENNTDSGEGIYAEPVDHPDQTLDDAEIHYAIIGNLVLLKIRPYQEEQTRYLVYNGKIQQAMRLDEIEQSCVMLPGDQGLIFPGGYYLQTGEFKTIRPWATATCVISAPSRPPTAKTTCTCSIRRSRAPTSNFATT